MLTWRVPINLPDAMRNSNKAITRRERDRKLYALTGFVRVVKLQADCDFHVQVAQSRAVNAPQVIVEVPHRFRSVQRELMALVAMGDGQKSKVWKDRSSAPHLRFIGFVFHLAIQRSGSGRAPVSVKLAALLMSAVG